MSNYYEKYLKYKSKYLLLKNQIGGDDEKWSLKPFDKNIVDKVIIKVVDLWNSKHKYDEAIKARGLNSLHPGFETEEEYFQKNMWRVNNFSPKYLEFKINKDDSFISEMYDWYHHPTLWSNNEIDEIKELIEEAVNQIKSPNLTQEPTIYKLFEVRNKKEKLKAQIDNLKKHIKDETWELELERKKPNNWAYVDVLEKSISDETNYIYDLENDVNNLEVEIKNLENLPKIKQAIESGLY